MKTPVQFKVLSLCALAIATACQGSVADTPAGDDDSPNVGTPKGPTKNDGPSPSPSSATVAQELNGILDCPTSPYPGTSMAAPNLSQPFGKACAACHGGSGEGAGAYPALHGSLTEAQFIAKVRQGAANMPAAGADLIDDATLGRDYRALKVRGAGGANETHPALTWSASQIEAKREAGMKLWRKADKDGVACAHCHSPDAIDLAVIAYSDAAIIRRATMHLPLQDALGLVDFVHAQRRHFKVARLCSTDWRNGQLKHAQIAHGHCLATLDGRSFQWRVTQDHQRLDTCGTKGAHRCAMAHAPRRVPCRSNRRVPHRA